MKHRDPHDAKAERIAKRLERRMSDSAAEREAAKLPQKLVDAVKAAPEPPSAEEEDELVAIQAEAAALGIETKASTVAGYKRAIKAHLDAKDEGE